MSSVPDVGRAAPAGPAQIFSATELIARAVVRNPDLRAIQYDAEAQRLAASQAGRFRDPELGFGFDHRNQYPGRGNGGGQNSNSGATAFGRLSLSQELSRPGRLRALEAAQSRAADALDVERRRAEVELKGQVLRRIYAFKIADEKTRHAKERYARFQTVESFMRSRPFVAPQSRAEISIVKTKLLALQRTFRQLEALREVAWLELNLYLGFDREVGIRAEWVTKVRALDEADLVRQGERENLEVRKQSALVEGQRQSLAATKLSAWPGTTLNLSYSDGSGANPERTFGLGLALPLPVLNGNRDARQAAAAATSAAEQRLGWTRLRLDQGVRAAFARYRAAVEVLESLAIRRLDGMEADMKSTDEGFKKGQVDLMTYLENDAQHFDTAFAILDTQADYLAALTDLLALVGRAPAAPGEA